MSKTRSIPEGAPFSVTQLRIPMTGDEGRRFDEAVKQSGMIKAKLLRILIVEWTDKTLGAPAPKAK